MKRLSLLAVAVTLLFSASGCCCGLFHGGCGGCGYPPPCGSCAPSCGSCGYAPVYAAPAPCSTCPTCPNGGCGVNGPMMQGAYYEGSSLGTALGATEMPTPATTSIAAANDVRTY